MYACNYIRPAESHPFSAFGAEEDRLRRFFCLRQQAATHYFSTSKAKMHFGWNCIKRRSNKQAREGWRLARIRQMLPARLSETCLSLLSSGDPLCVALTAIKPSSWFLAHMRSQTELLMKYERPFLLGLQSWMCFFSWISAELFTLTPWIPTVTRFSLWTHHLLTHRLTSLTLQCEGVAASMNHWLVGESSLSSVCVFEMDFFIFLFLSVVLKTPIQIIMTLHCVYESVSCIWGRTELLWQCIHWLGEKVCVCERQRMWTSSRSFLSVTEGTELLSLSGLIVSH